MNNQPKVKYINSDVKSDEMDVYSRTLAAPKVDGVRKSCTIYCL